MALAAGIKVAYIVIVIVNCESGDQPIVPTLFFRSIGIHLDLEHNTLFSYSLK